MRRGRHIATCALSPQLHFQPQPQHSASPRLRVPGAPQPSVSDSNDVGTFLSTSIAAGYDPRNSRCVLWSDDQLHGMDLVVFQTIQPADDPVKPT